jgi:hypothetical protein
MEHKDGRIQYLCIQCSQPICIHCLMLNHNGHKIDFIHNNFQPLPSYMASLQMAPTSAEKPDLFQKSTAPSTQIAAAENIA